MTNYYVLQIKRIGNILLPLTLIPKLKNDRTSESERANLNAWYKAAIVNWTFENRTQSHKIHGLSSIEYGNRTKSNSTRLSVSLISEHVNINRINRTKLNPIHLIVFDFGNRTQSNTTKWTALNLFKASPSKQVFLVLFYNVFNNGNPIY